MLAAPFLYNMMAPVFWSSGALTALVGFALLISSNSKTRVPLLNVFVALLIFHTAMIIAYGSQMVYQMRNIYLLHQDTLAAAIDKGVEIFVPKESIKHAVSKDSTAFSLVEKFSVGLIFKMSPYPMNFIFFMGLRPDIAVLLWVIIPGIFSLFSIPFLIAIRNYFASDLEGVKDHRSPYKNVALSKFICQGVPRKPGDEEFEDAEEDLASTFDGVYDDESFASSENDEQGPLVRRR